MAIFKIWSNLIELSLVGWTPGPWFNIKMLSYPYRKSHCGDKTVVRSSYLHNGISYTGKMSSLYWMGALVRMVSRINNRHHNLLNKSPGLKELIFSRYPGHGAIAARQESTPPGHLSTEHEETLDSLIMHCGRCPGLFGWISSRLQ